MKEPLITAKNIQQLLTNKKTKIGIYVRRINTRKHADPEVHGKCQLKNSMFVNGGYVYA